MDQHDKKITVNNDCIVYENPSTQVDIKFLQHLMCRLKQLTLTIKLITKQFLAALSSSRSLVIYRLVGLSVLRLCEKVTFTYLPTYTLC